MHTQTLLTILPGVFRPWLESGGTDRRRPYTSTDSSLLVRAPVHSGTHDKKIWGNNAPLCMMSKRGDNALIISAAQSEITVSGGVTQHPTAD